MCGLQQGVGPPRMNDSEVRSATSGAMSCAASSRCLQVPQEAPPQAGALVRVYIVLGLRSVKVSRGWNVLALSNLCVCSFSTILIWYSAIYLKWCYCVASSSASLHGQCPYVSPQYINIQCAQHFIHLYIYILYIYNIHTSLIYVYVGGCPDAPVY